MDRGHKMTLAAVGLSTLILAGVVVAKTQPQVVTKTVVEKVVVTPTVTATPSATLAPTRNVLPFQRLTPTSTGAAVRK